MKKRVLIYCSIVLALFTLAGTSFIYLNKLNALEVYTEKVEHTHLVINQLSELEKSVLDGETGQRGFILTHDSAYLEPYFSCFEKTSGIFLELDYATSDNHVQQDRLDTLKALINARIQKLRENLSMQVPYTDSALQNLDKGRELMDDIRELVARMKVHENDLLYERDRVQSQNTKETKATSYIILVAAFALCCIACIGLILFFNNNQKYQARLREKNETLQAIHREIKQLALTSTHTLQEPMRKMQIMIDWVLSAKSMDDGHVRERLERIRKIYGEQQRINNAIVDYYDVLTVEANPEKIGLDAWLNDFFHQRPDKDLELEVKTPLAITFDKKQLQLLFENLSDNSQRFCKPDHRLSIRVLYRGSVAVPGKPGSEKYHLVAVTDNGQGINPADREKIFELFNKQTEDPGETLHIGMGLSFCRRIMLNHRGYIEAEPYADGLTILLYFPL